MKKLSRAALLSLEEYSAKRKEFRARVMQHKKNRRLSIGPNATLYFEDTLTVQYQIQEMLRAERIFEADGIQEELDAYNPLIPDGGNWKATFMIEFADAGDRRKALQNMIEIENSVWLKINGMERVRPVSDEDIERSSDQKTSAVHFLRFELTPEMISALKNGDGTLTCGIDHPAYDHQVSPVPNHIRDSLIADLS